MQNNVYLRYSSRFENSGWGGGLAVIESVFVSRSNLYFGIILLVISLFLFAIKKSG